MTRELKTRIWQKDRRFRAMLLIFAIFLGLGVQSLHAVQHYGFVTQSECELQKLETRGQAFFFEEEFCLVCRSHGFDAFPLPDLSRFLITALPKQAIRDSILSMEFTVTPVRFKLPISQAPPPLV